MTVSDLLGGAPTLERAEERAGISHRPRRGAHGLRRLVAGEVAEHTGNAKLAIADVLGLTHAD